MAQYVDPRAYIPGPMVGGAPVRGDSRVIPRLPLHPAPPSRFESNDATSSGRKRRAVGTGPGRRPTSINYGQAYSTAGQPRQNENASSFANRAHGLSADFQPDTGNDPATTFAPRRERHMSARVSDRPGPRGVFDNPQGLAPHSASARFTDRPGPRGVFDSPQGVATHSANSQNVEDLPDQPPDPATTSEAPRIREKTEVPEASAYPSVQPFTKQRRRRRSNADNIIRSSYEPLEQAEPQADTPTADHTSPEDNDYSHDDRHQEPADDSLRQRQPVRVDTKRPSAGAPEPWEWAADKSPLQQLEGRFNTISRTKEEKRARAERAEQRLRERRQSEKNGALSADQSFGRRVSSSRHSAPKDTRSPAQVYLDTYENIEKKNPSYAQAAPPYKNRDSIRGDGTGSDAAFKALNGERDVPVKPNRSENTDLEDKKASDLEHRSSRKAGAQAVEGTPVQSLSSSSPQVKDKSSRGATSNPTAVSEQRHSRTVNDFGDTRESSEAAQYGVHHSNQARLRHQLPPQKTSGIEARQAVGFDNNLAHKEDVSMANRNDILDERLQERMERSAQDNTSLPHKPLEEWRQAGTARLTAADLAPRTDLTTEQKAWWEREAASGTKGRAKQSKGAATAFDGSYDSILNESARFDPPLYLKCGPLLRYTGLKRDKLQASREGQLPVERETWRGSVMIVTVDSGSKYQPAPTLRIFAEPMQLLPPPTQQNSSRSEESLPPEYVDPVAGLPKMSRTGRMVYVKPVEDLQPEMDLSRLEGDDGLYEVSRTAVVPTSYGKPDPRTSGDPALRVEDSQPGQKRRRHRSQEVRGIRLLAERGLTFWRFNLEVELGAKQARIAYRINNSPSIGFWVPAKGEVMNTMFYSCNGFSSNIQPADFSGPDPMWRDVLNSHQTRPFHVMIGGGDQIYNDPVMDESSLLHAWLEMKSSHRHDVPFTPDIQEELETIYLERYCMWFSQGLFGMANSQIPMVNIWNDRDIIDGFGSYPDHFMDTSVFCGLGAVAYKYYMLFQHQSVPAEITADEPSWVLGAAPGPYINELSRSVYMSLGKHVAFIGIDCITERMKEEVMSEESYHVILDRCHREIVDGETKHLIVLLGVPIAYPRLVWLENLLTSRAMDPIKAVARMSFMGGYLNKFDGGVEVLDDLDSQWTAQNHKAERHWLIEELQELAAEKSVRITFLSGNAQLAAVGQFYSNPKLGIRKDRDHRYMPNVISSAIVNAPPPDMMADVLNKRDKIHHLDPETDEDMIPMFTHDVDYRIRNNKRLFTRRNWCSIREYQPGSTPPVSRSPSPSADSFDQEGPQRPMGRLQRTLSLTRDDVKPGNLIRRLSQKGPPPTSMKYPIPNDQYPPSPPDSDPNLSADGHASFQQRQRLGADPQRVDSGQRHSSAPLPRPGNFQRRPTNFSLRAIKKGGAEDDNDGHISLEHGLDIVLNCEENPRNPAGTTVPYRLLVPALWYEGHPELNPPMRRKSLLSRIGSIKIPGRRMSGLARNQGRGNWGGSASTVEHSGTQSPERQTRPFEARPPKAQQIDYLPTQEKALPPLKQNTAPPQFRTFKSHENMEKAAPPNIPDSQQPVRHTPPPVGVRMMEMRGADKLEDYYDDPPTRDTGYPGRRPSKLDKVLGIGSHRQAQKYGDNDHVDEVDQGQDLYSDEGDFAEDVDAGPPPPARRPSMLQRVLSVGRRRQPKQYADYEDDLSTGGGSYSEDDEEDHYTSNGRPVSMGYSGIEAYQEKEKGWKRWFS